jgi:hypothetical protein
MSLSKILNDPSLMFDSERLAKKTEEVKKDKKALTNAADHYNQRFQQEIEEGTKKRQMLITDGARRGLSEDHVIGHHGSFIPSVRTPILNFLYFMMREENVDLELEETRRRYDKEYGQLEESYTAESSEDIEAPPEMETFIYGSCTSKDFQTIKKLKTLALDGSCNENESALAFSMCMKLCKKFSLEFDKIPVNNR